MQKIPRGFFPGNSFHPEQSLVFPVSRFQRMLGLGGGVEVMRDLNIFSDGNSFKIRHRLESLCYYQFIFSICIFLWFLCDLGGVTQWVLRGEGFQVYPVNPVKIFIFIIFFFASLR